MMVPSRGEYGTNIVARPLRTTGLPILLLVGSALEEPMIWEPSSRRTISSTSAATSTKMETASSMSQTDINRRNRQRGKAFERRVVQIFRDAGFDCRRMPFSGAAVEYGKGDVEFLDGVSLFVECKNYREDIMNLFYNGPFMDILNKASEQADDKTPIIAMRDTKGRIFGIVGLPYKSDILTYKTLRFGCWRVLPLDKMAEGLAGAYLPVGRRGSVNTEGEGS